MSTPPNVTGALQGLTVAVTGASGNLGTALLRRLRASGVAKVRGLSRRPPPETAPYDGVEWRLTDLSGSDSEAVLADFLTGVDAVVHLAWALQPARDPDLLRRVNVDGTRRVADAALAAGVPHVVHMSSLGAYSPARPGRRVTEDWTTSGLPTAQYSRDKVAAERVVRDVFGRRPAATLTVVRPTLVLQPEAGSEIGRYFLGPLGLTAARLLPGAVARRLPLPLPDLHLQAALSTSPPSRSWTPPAWPGRSATDGCRCPPECCGQRCRWRSPPGWCPPSPAGWTSPPRAPHWTAPVPGRCSTGRRCTGVMPCCASSWPQSGAARARRGRCCGRPAVGLPTRQPPRPHPRRGATERSRVPVIPGPGDHHARRFGVPATGPLEIVGVHDVSRDERRRC